MSMWARRAWRRIKHRCPRLWRAGTRARLRFSAHVVCPVIGHRMARHITDMFVNLTEAERERMEDPWCDRCGYGI